MMKEEKECVLGNKILSHGYFALHFHFSARNEASRF